MNPFFLLLSAVYIFAIFFGADSPMVSQISAFNPYSLLHIPLYGILILFLLLAFSTEQRANSKRQYMIAALITIGVAILDEIHQSFIPSRDGSILDIFLDVSGILLVIFLFHRVSPLLRASFFKKLKRVEIDSPS